MTCGFDNNFCNFDRERKYVSLICYLYLSIYPSLSLSIYIHTHTHIYIYICMYIMLREMKSQFPALTFMRHTFTYLVYLKIKKNKVIHYNIEINHKIQLLSIHRIISFDIT